jgi:hypothetical protein
MVLVTGPPVPRATTEARTVAGMEYHVAELHVLLRDRDAVILYAQARLAEHGEQLNPAQGGVTLLRLRLLEDVRDLADRFARMPHDEDRRRELLDACDRARRA